MDTARILSKAGYVFFAAILLAIIIFLGYLYAIRSRIAPKDMKVCTYIPPLWPPSKQQGANPADSKH